jgi:hypothetical protein
MHRVFISPVAGHCQRGPQYSVSFEGQQIVATSVTPFLDAARALKARGLTGRLEMWDHERPYPRMRGDIEKAAGLRVKEGDESPKFAPWVPFEGDALSRRPVSETTAIPEEAARVVA